jgi:hypothetical protein
MTDLAPELLNWLDEHLRPGEEYAIRDERSWTRWPHRYRQQVEVAPPRPDRDVPTTRAVATTPLVTDLADPELALEMAIGANRVASLSAVVVDEAAGTVALACAASLRPGNRVWLLPVLGEVLKLQIAVPERGDPDALAAGFGGVADIAPHPVSGPRKEPHPELAVVEAYQRAGLEPGRIPIGTFAASVGDLHAMSIPSTVDGTRLTVGAETFHLGGTAQITVEHASHPGFGNGLLAVLRTASAPAAAHPARAVNELNRRELWERLDGQTFGAWSYDDAGLGHLVFYPNRLIPIGEAERRARLVNCVLDEVRRLAWLDRVWADAAGISMGDAAGA